MIKLRNNRTGLEHEISEEAWEKMKGNGRYRKYTVLDSGKKKKPLKMPDESSSADYDRLLKRGTELFKKQDWEQARVVFEQAKAIKETPYTIGKLNEINSKLSEADKE